MSLRIDTTELIASSLVIGDVGLGVDGSSISTAGFVYPRLTFPSDNTKEIRALITSTTFPAGTFFLNEDTSYTTTAPAGSYTVNYTLYRDGVSIGSFSDTVNSGSEAILNITTSSGTSAMVAGGRLKKLVIDTTDLIAGSLTIGDTGHGVYGIDVPSTGEHGPGYLYNDLNLPTDNYIEVRGQILSSTFPAGTFFAFEDSSFTVTGAPTGIYSFTYQLYVDGVAIGSPATSNVTIFNSNGSFDVTTDDATSSIASTGFLKKLVIDTVDLIPGSLTIGDTGHGVYGIDVPSTGEHGPGYLYNDLDLPADNYIEVRGQILSSTFPAGTFFAFENSSFNVTGAPGGTYSFTYQLYVDGVPVGSPASSTVVVSNSSTFFTTTTDDSVVSGSANQFVTTSINASTDGAVIAGSANPFINGSFNTITYDAAFSGSAYSLVNGSFVITTEDAVFSGTAEQPAPALTSFELITDSAVITGSAEQAPPALTSFNLTTDNVLFSGLAETEPYPITSFDITTDNAVFSGSAEQVPPVLSQFTLVTDDSVIVGSAEQAPPIPCSFNVTTDDNVLGGSAAQADAIIGSFTNTTEDAVFSGLAEQAPPVIGAFNITTDSAFISGSAAQVPPVTCSFTTTTDDSFIIGAAQQEFISRASFNLFTENTTVSGSAEPSVPLGGSFDITTASPTSGLVANVSAEASFNSTTDDSVIDGLAGFISNTNFSVTTESSTASFDVLGFTNSSVQFNTTTASPISNMAARNEEVTPPPKGGIAVHLGGGVCITSNGQLFVVIM